MLENPGAVDLLGGNLASLAQRSFIDALGGKDVGFKAAVEKKLELLRKDLLGENPTPVERLLVARVVACWLQVQDAEIRYAQFAKDLTIRQGDYHQRRMDAAHRRYLSAIKALAQVRKLALPVVQVNIAKKQTNIAAGSVAAPGVN
jgi:hypothetical protein